MQCAPRPRGIHVRVRSNRANTRRYAHTGAPPAPRHSTRPPPTCETSARDFRCLKRGPALCWISRKCDLLEPIEVFASASRSQPPRRTQSQPAGATSVRLPRDAASGGGPARPWRVQCRLGTSVGGELAAQAAQAALAALPASPRIGRPGNTRTNAHTRPRLSSSQGRCRSNFTRNIFPPATQLAGAAWARASPAAPGHLRRQATASAKIARHGSRRPARR